MESVFRLTVNQQNGSVFGRCPAHGFLVNRKETAPTQKGQPRRDVNFPAGEISAWLVHW